MDEHIGTDLAPYDLWESKELITVTGGTSDFKNDYKFIISHLKELVKEYDLIILGIGIDPHNADGILADLEEFGCPVLVITQTAKFLNDATVDVQLAIKSEKVEYNEENELLTWSATNAKVIKTYYDDIKIDKEPNAKFKRIDPIDAIIDSHTVYMKNKDSEPVDLNKEIEEYLREMGWNE